LGMYEKAILNNIEGIKRDNKYTEYAGTDNFYSFYRMHNYHFLVYAAMFDGQYQLAIKTARELSSQIPEQSMKDIPDLMEAFYTMIFHVHIRFGMGGYSSRTPSLRSYYLLLYNLHSSLCSYHRSSFP